MAGQGYEVKAAYGRNSCIPEQYRKYGIRIGDDRSVRLHGLYTRLTDRHALASKNATRVFLEWAERFDPEMLWLHNIHGYYLNYELLFCWIKSRPGMKVKWMLHDCWSFTGHCSYFSAIGCERWKTACEKCPLKYEYPKSLIRDGSRENYQRKKAAFRGVTDMELYVPSRWLERLVKESFLGYYRTVIRPHRIDQHIFHPMPGDFRERYGLKDKKIVLGVANIWEKRKGLSDFLELAKRLDDSYQIVLVGLSEKQRKSMPSNILGLPRTDSMEKLAEIYTAADVFVNPSVEETFGLTGLEALACGTKTICYRGTACEEAIKADGGIAVERDPDKLVTAIYEVAG